MKVKSEIEAAQSCSTLSDPMDWSLPGSSIRGIFQARVLEWGAITFFVIGRQWWGKGTRYIYILGYTLRNKLFSKVIALLYNFTSNGCQF